MQGQRQKITEKNVIFSFLCTKLYARFNVTVLFA